MAKVSNPLIGATSGSVGGVTFSKWKGIDVIKTKPTVVANPNTDKQKSQRLSFAMIIMIYRVLVAIVNLGFKQLAISQSAYNAFTQANLKTAFDKSVPGVTTFQPELFLISKGTMSDTVISSVTVDESDVNCVVTFPMTFALPGQSATDKPLVAVYNITKDDWASGVGAGERSTGTATIAIPAAWEEADLTRVYLGFVNADGSEASDSKNMAATIAA